MLLVVLMTVTIVLTNIPVMILRDTLLQFISRWGKQLQRALHPLKNCPWKSPCQTVRYDKPRTIQKLGRLQDSNAVLSHFNEYSEHCFSEISVEFSWNTRLLRSMKSDLDYIFQKLRSMKSRILATYPVAFTDDSTGAVVDRRSDLEIPL